MAISYNTSTLKITVTSLTNTRALYDDVQTTFAGASYMQYQIPMVGNIKDALYTLANGWLLFDNTSLGFLQNGGLIDTAINNRWTNTKTISGNTFTGIQLYYNQTGAPVNFSSTGLVNTLLKVRNNGTDINSESYTVFSRPYGYTYSQFTVTASAGGIDTVPMSVGVDSQITIPQVTVDAYSDLTITWTTIYRSAFNGVSTTKYTLNGSHTNSVTTFTVTENIDASVPSTGSFQVGSEVITYTGKTLHTFTGCTRAQYYTAAASYSTGISLSTNTKQYSVLIKTTDTSRRLNEIYNWIQSRLTKNVDIDSLSGGHIGSLTNPLVSYTGTMITSAGVWVEGFSTSDSNSISFTDVSSASHTPPLTIPIVVNIDPSIVGAQVYVATLNTTGLTDATYSTSNIVSTLINQVSVAESTSVTIVYTADTPCRVVVRYPGYQQFSLYTLITSLGLNVTSQTPVDSTY